MREQIKAVFDAHIKKAFKSRPDLARYFLNHERKNLCLNNLVEEVKKAEWMLGGKMEGEGGKEKFILMVEQTASLFCRAAIGQRENEVMSSAERRRHEIAPEKHLLEFEAEINEENAKVHRGQIVGAGWKPVAKNQAQGRKIPKLLLP